MRDWGSSRFNKFNLTNTTEYAIIDLNKKFLVIKLNQGDCMTRDTRIGWFAQACAVIGVSLWIGVTMYFKLYPIVTLIAVTAVPATIYNIIQETRRAA
jgi:hypothetical protein